MIGGRPCGGHLAEVFNERDAVREECIAGQLVEVGKEKEEDAELDHIRGDAVVIDEGQIDKTLK